MGVVPLFEGYTMNAFETMANLKAYTDQYGAIIRQFADATLAELRTAGFRVTILATPEELCNPNAGCYDSVGYSVTLSRDGISQLHTVGDRGQAARFNNAREAAEYIASVFWQNAPTLQSNPFTQSSYGYVQPLITPTADTTLPTNQTLQPVQAPPPPEQSGTVTGSAGGSVPVPPPPTTETTPPTRTFDEWNWYYRQRTGQIPPAPETVGFPAGRRAEQITFAEWSQYTAGWFAAQNLPPASVVMEEAPPADSGGNTFAGADYFTLIAAVLALLGVR